MKLGAKEYELSPITKDEWENFRKIINEFAKNTFSKQNVFVKESGQLTTGMSEGIPDEYIQQILIHIDTVKHIFLLVTKAPFEDHQLVTELNKIEVLNQLWPYMREKRENSINAASTDIVSNPERIVGYAENEIRKWIITICYDLGIKIPTLRIISMTEMKTIKNPYKFCAAGFFSGEDYSITIIDEKFNIAFCLAQECRHAWQHCNASIADYMKSGMSKEQDANKYAENFINCHNKPDEDQYYEGENIFLTNEVLSKYEPVQEQRQEQEQKQEQEPFQCRFSSRQYNYNAQRQKNLQETTYLATLIFGVMIMVLFLILWLAF